MACKIFLNIYNRVYFREFYSNDVEDLIIRLIVLVGQFLGRDPLIVHV